LIPRLFDAMPARLAESAAIPARRQRIMTQTATQRIANFSAGPAALPLEVLEEVRDNILSLGDTGVGIMEHSHRGKAFMAVAESAEKQCRELLGLSDDYAVLFLQGGASTLFYEVPMSFLQGGTADYLVTGVWAEKATKEAKRFGKVVEASSSADKNHSYVPKSPNWTAGARYAHYTSNNTIFGTEYHAVPKCSAPLICDSSSNMMSKPMEIEKHALMYAGAQKNLGPSGVVLVIVRKDYAETGASDIPTMAQFRTHIKEGSMYNTPNTFGIFVMDRVFAWMKRQGGLAAIAKMNQAKAKLLYDAIDASPFWSTPVAKEDRSLMNIVFRLRTEELENKLIKEAGAAGFDGLKGHRSVGGLRASVYNAFPMAHMAEFVAFMKEFERKNG
jgi:phosphoserine aminotransferase